MSSPIVRVFSRERGLFLVAAILCAGAVFLGAPIEFALFALTLAGVALFHHQTLYVALTGLAVVTVDDGVIAGIETIAEKPADAVGSASSSIWPGLIDIQVNGAFGHDFSNPGSDPSLACKGLPRYGVTAFQPVIITSPQALYERALANLKVQAQPGWARILGVHIEGPYLAPKRVGAHNPDARRDPRVQEVAEWLEWGDVRLVTLAPELPGAQAVIPYLTRRGVVVSMGHSDATYDEARRGVDLGATLVTHLFNAKPRRASTTQSTSSGSSP